jgi:AcrR family transcriptional regulator
MLSSFAGCPHPHDERTPRKGTTQPAEFTRSRGNAFPAIECRSSAERVPSALLVRLYETCAYRKYVRITSGTHQFQKGGPDLQSGADPGRPPGRPRDARADRAILEATLELIAQRGVYEFRTEDVAARAGVGKGAIYRRYGSKDELVTAAIAALVSEEIVVPDTGSTRGDLLVLMREAVGLYRGSLAARLMPNLIGAMAQKPELARAVRQEFLAPRRAALSEVLRRGVQRGDLRPDLDLDLALDVLGGPLFYRLLVTGGPIDELLAAGVADLILRGFSPDESRGTRRVKERKEQRR